MDTLSLTSSFSSWSLYNHIVFLRADLNVPLVNKHIKSDFRLKAVLPTLNLLITKGARIILASHLGRPKGQDQSLSTKLLMPWFKEHGYSIEFASCLEQAQLLINLAKPGTLVLLENLRFWPQEQEGDKDFASSLARLAEYYVNDAFGVIHRNDTSVTLLPELYDPAHKSIGLLIEKELKSLDYLACNAQQPFLLIVGGGKIKDKLPLVQALLSKVSTVALCPALVFTFLKALGKPVGKSLVDDTLMYQARALLKKGAKHGVSFLFPEDYYVSTQAGLRPPYKVIPADNFSDHDTGVSIGPKTVDTYKHAINTAHTIFLNGAFCITEQPESCIFFNAVLKALAQSSAYTVIGGGDSVGAVYAQKLEDKINFCSTGGGATLTYLSGQPLPGLISMLV